MCCTLHDPDPVLGAIIVNKYTLKNGTRFTNFSSKQKSYDFVVLLSRRKRLRKLCFFFLNKIIGSFQFVTIPDTVPVKT